jgi:hypothetical protein
LERDWSVQGGVCRGRSDIPGYVYQEVTLLEEGKIMTGIIGPEVRKFGNWLAKYRTKTSRRTEIGELFMDIADNVSEKVESVTEEALRGRCKVF